MNINLLELLTDRPRDAVRLYLAERDSDLGIPQRILSPVLMLALPRLNGEQAAAEARK